MAGWILWPSRTCGQAEPVVRWNLWPSGDAKLPTVPSLSTPEVGTGWFQSPEPTRMAASGPREVAAKGPTTTSHSGLWRPGVVLGSLPVAHVGCGPWGQRLEAGMALRLGWLSDQDGLEVRGLRCLRRDGTCT